MEFPMPMTSPEEQALIARSPVENRVTLSDSYRNTPANHPPAYDDRSLSRLRGGSHLGEVDVLDHPAPAPSSSTFASSRPAFPPDINIEDGPPVAQESWRDLAAERDGRRRTFGTHTVVEPTPGLNSQYPSVYSVRSHLRPEGDRSGSRSDPSSNHSQGGSHLSRHSTHSQLVSVGSDHSYGSIRSIPEEGSPRRNR
ncbi:hypothetical protein BDY19DRAFT_380720 [Irpex rosettiformis]|uniref:Uncharacterized protein n=1 Tax=Irpex rosettiformis TaxID=378272 RepID=A0ACB8TVU6_9APHY|nr:hypothetical protein BDY19DRAFT_380720 [Irpex rosettiformis]